MRWFRFAKAALAMLLLVGFLSFGYAKRAVWRNWLALEKPPSHAEAEHGQASSPLQQVMLSPQAQVNLRITAKPLRLQTFWKTIQLPGQVVDRPGFSDRGVVAPITGVVTKVHRLPGDTVRPGDPLFTLRLVSESMQLAQTELFKASKETEITQETKTRLNNLNASGAIPQSRMIELDNQLRRLGVTEQAYRLELQTRGLTPTQIDSVATGTFVTETVIVVPQRRTDDKPLTPDKANVADDPPTPYEMQELKVELGQQVQAGQTLCLLSHHESLYIEGRGFRQEVPLLERTIQESWPVEIEFMEDGTSEWPQIPTTFTIRHISNTIDPSSRTFAFFLPLTNQSRTYEKDGRTMLMWRFRPGQRVRLQVRTEKLENVFVLPSDAIVREGPEAYVFRQNGDLFDRKSIRVLYQDRQNAIVANDGSIPPGVFLAQNAATQLNRVLKAQSASGQANVHVHADGTVHANH